MDCPNSAHGVRPLELGPFGIPVVKSISRRPEYDVVSRSPARCSHQTNTYPLTQPIIVPILFPRAWESFLLVQIPSNRPGRHVWDTSTPILRIIRGVLWSTLLPSLSITMVVLGGPGDPCALDIPFAHVNESGG